MWIIYFESRPQYWLLCGRSYTLGRKDASILVENDVSISRHHITITIGEMLPVAVGSGDRQSHVSMGSATRRASCPHYAVCTLTDHSKLGSATRVPGKEAVPVLLPRGSEWSTSPGCERFDLIVGTRGTTFEIRWHPTPVFLALTDAATKSSSDLPTKMRTSGFFKVDDVTSAAIVVATSLDPTPAIMAALCLAKPIVSPEYVTKVVQRLDCKVPVPEPASLLELPRQVDEFWARLLDVPSVAAVDRELFLPQPRRASLFSGVTFVVPQRDVYDEVIQYVPHTRAHLTFDTFDVSTLDAFATCHHGHVVLYVDFPSPAQEGEAGDSERGHPIGLTPGLTQSRFNRSNGEGLATDQRRIEFSRAAAVKLKGRGVGAVSYFAVLRAIFTAQFVSIEALTPGTGESEKCLDTCEPGTDAQEHGEREAVDTTSERRAPLSNKCTPLALKSQRRESEMVSADHHTPHRDTTRSLFPDRASGTAGNDEHFAAVSAVVPTNDSGWRRRSDVPGKSASINRENPHESVESDMRNSCSSLGENVTGPQEHKRHSTESDAAAAPAAPLLPEDHLVLRGPLIFPDFPCFDRGATLKPTTPQYSEVTSKCFRKQSVCDRHGPIIEMEVVRPPSALAITSRIAPVDALDLIADRSDPRSTCFQQATTSASSAGNLISSAAAASDPFNVFDIAAHHREEKAKARVPKRSSAMKHSRSATALITANTSKQVIKTMGSSVVDARGRSLIAPLRSPTATAEDHPKPDDQRNRATPPARAGTAMNIFDVDAMY